ncbi:MAG: hypothetical protein LBL34_06370 [Clostridiales bacterium]|jgi:hypothetical protein|nr:hypothetical protein [Clostridiales bacterium]
MDITKVLSETYAVLEKLGERYISLIPKDVFADIEAGRDKTYTPIVDEDKDLDKQGLSKEAIALIFSLKRDYMCDTQEEKDGITAIMEANDEKLKAMFANAKSTMQLLRMFKENK